MHSNQMTVRANVRNGEANKRDDGIIDANKRDDGSIDSNKRDDGTIEASKSDDGTIKANESDGGLIEANKNGSNLKGNDINAHIVEVESCLRASVLDGANEALDSSDMECNSPERDPSGLTTRTPQKICPRTSTVTHLYTAAEDFFLVTKMHFMIRKSLSTLLSNFYCPLSKIQLVRQPLSPLSSNGNHPQSKMQLTRKPLT